MEVIDIHFVEYYPVERQILGDSNKCIVIDFPT